MRIVNMHEAKTSLSRLVEAVEAGEEVVIARNGRPVARLVALVEQNVGRRIGVAEHRFVDLELDEGFDTEVAESFMDRAR